MSTLKLTPAAQAAAADVLAAIRGELAAVQSRGKAVAALLRAVGWTSASGALSAKGKTGNASALAAAVVPAVFTRDDGTVVTFAAVGNGSKAQAAALAAGDAPNASPEAVADATYLREVGAVQRAISRALADAKPDAPKATRKPRAAKPADTLDIAPVLVTAMETLAAGKMPEGMSADTAIALGKAGKALAALEEVKAIGKPATPAKSVADMLQDMITRGESDAATFAACRAYVQRFASLYATPATSKPSTNSRKAATA
jgi:hypothetical protein